MFMEGTVIVILLAPIFVPLVKNFGMDPVFFGIIMCIVVVVGLFTPPVGIGMYTVMGLLKTTMPEFLKETIPFIITIFILIGILTIFPQIVLFLPNLLYS